MRFAFVSLVAALPLLASAAGESLREKPPFSAPAPAQPAASSNALATLELVGIAVIEKEPRFGLRDIGTNRSYWLTLNREQDGLTVVSYDARNNTATVQGRGTSRLLVLKAETITTAAGSQPTTVNYTSPVRAAASPVAAAAPQPVPQPEPVPANLTPEQKKQRQAETEARMLVSDLMEISMQERARYAEEQRRRAVGQQGVPQAAPQTPPQQSPAPVNPPTK